MTQKKHYTDKELREIRQKHAKRFSDSFWVAARIRRKRHTTCKEYRNEPE